jgi:hypothetical protein
VLDDVSRRLRLAVVIADKPLPRWVHEVLGTVVKDPRIDVRLVVGKTARLPGASLLLRLFRRLDRRRAVSHSAMMQAEQFVAHGDTLPRTTLAEFDPDVIWQVVPTQAPASERYGVWHYEFDSGFNTIRQGKAESCARLMASGTTTHLLGTAHVRTHPTSPAIIELELQLAGQRLLRDAIDRLLAHAWTPQEFFAQHRLIKPEPPKPSPGIVSFGTSVLLPRLLRSRTESRNEWTIAIAPTRNDGLPDVARASWLALPANGFVADPFVWKHDGLLYVFVEELPFDARKGHISVTRWHPQLGFDALEPVLNDSHHLSFPFLFEHEGRLFMMPECHESGHLRCFECVEFPHRWINGEPIMKEMRCVDAVLVQHDGRWWLFLSRATGQIADDNLYAFHADSPWGPWTAHTMNPVRTGLRGSRMAGSFFKDNTGRLLRPAQDCSRAYGGAVVLFAVEELTPHTYRETEIAAIDPKTFPAPWNERCHTFQHAGAWAIFDACRATPVSPA